MDTLKRVHTVRSWFLLVVFLEQSLFLHNYLHNHISIWMVPLCQHMPVKWMAVALSLQYTLLILRWGKKVLSVHFQAISQIQKGSDSQDGEACSRLDKCYLGSVTWARRCDNSGFHSRTGQFSKKILNSVTLLGDSHFKLSWDYFIDNCRYTHMTQKRFWGIYLETTKVG